MCVFVCVCICMHVCMCVHVCVCICMHVCMYVHVCMCVHVCMHVYVYTSGLEFFRETPHTHTHTYPCTHTHIHSHAHTYSHTFMQHTLMSIHTYTLMFIYSCYTHSCTYTLTHVHTLMHEHTHTYTHTLTHTRVRESLKRRKPAEHQCCSLSLSASRALAPRDQMPRVLAAESLSTSWLTVFLNDEPEINPFLTLFCQAFCQCDEKSN